MHNVYITEPKLRGKKSFSVESFELVAPYKHPKVISNFSHQLSNYTDSPHCPLFMVFAALVSVVVDDAPISFGKKERFVSRFSV
jgi:hypothetical protein